MRNEHYIGGVDEFTGEQFHDLDERGTWLDDINDDRVYIPPKEPVTPSPMKIREEYKMSSYLTMAVGLVFIFLVIMVGSGLATAVSVCTFIVGFLLILVGLVQYMDELM